MYDSKTFRSDDTQLTDPLYDRQKQDVAKMRASLLSFDGNDPMSARIALQNITIMRVYHQISRIIRYTEMMDKIEDKLYESIECSLDAMDSSNPSTWLALLGVQEKLQKAMIESHKLLQPYLDMDLFSNIEIIQPDPDPPFGAMIMDQESRDRLRTSAQTILAALESGVSQND